MNLSSGFVAEMAVATKGWLSCFLLAACFAIPAWGGEHDMTVEELAQKLEEAGDWPREKSEALLGVKFVDHNPGEAMVSGRFVYGKGLVINKISHRRLADTHETRSLRVVLGDESSCFTLDRLKKSYPGVELEFSSYGLYFVHKKPWGEIKFDFVQEHKDKGGKFCLLSIETETNRSLDIWRERYKSNKK